MAMCQHSPWRRQVSSSIVPLSGVALLAVSAAPSHPLHPCIAIACHIACRLRSGSWPLATVTAPATTSTCVAAAVGILAASPPIRPSIHPRHLVGRIPAGVCRGRRRIHITHSTMHRRGHSSQRHARVCRGAAGDGHLHRLLHRNLGGFRLQDLPVCGNRQGACEADDFGTLHVLPTV